MGWRSVTRIARSVFFKRQSSSVICITFGDRPHLILTQGKIDEAESRFERALAIQERTLGPEHSAVATTLVNWAHSLVKQARRF